MQERLPCRQPGMPSTTTSFVALKSEPVINFNYMRKRKIWRRGDPAGLSFDTAINGNVGLGNLVTQASTALEMRFGHNMPRGFVYVPDPIGWSMHYKALLRPANPRAASFYATLVLRGSAFAHNIFLDGNTFSDSHSVDKEPLAGQAIAGLHYEKRRCGYEQSTRCRGTRASGHHRCRVAVLNRRNRSVM